MKTAALLLLLSAHEDLEIQIARLTERIRTGPPEGRLHLQRAELHRLHRAWAEARADYVRARALDPGLTRVHLGLGRVELEDGRPAEALRHLDAYVTGRPEDAVGRLERARAHAALGAWEAAKTDFDAALSRMAEAPPDLHLERIRAVRAADGHVEAMRALDAAVGRFGPIITLLTEALEAELAAGRLEEALGRVDAILRTTGRKDSWLVRRGEILERLGRGGAAREAYAAALREIESLPPARRRTRDTAEREAALRARIRPEENP